MAVEDVQAWVEKRLHVRLQRGVAPELAIERVPTGLLGVDWVLDGGIPLGRIIEVWGMPKHGKTSLVLEWVREFLARDYPVFYFDLEHALDPALMRIHGVDPNQVYFPQAEEGEVLWGEDLFVLLMTLARSVDHGLFVIDSVPALLTRRMLVDKDVNNLLSDSPGTVAQLLSKGLRALTGSGVLAKRRNTLVCINQLRQQINAYHPSFVHPGGLALGYYASVSLEVRRGEVYEDPETKEQNGHEVLVRCDKNKAGMAYRSAAIPLFYAIGFDRYADAVSTGVAVGVVDQRGSWLQWGDSRWQGRDRMAEALAADPVLWDQFVAAVRQRMIKEADPVNAPA